MGILNVTPDSFSDGGKYLEVEDAIQHAIALEKSGADIIDIGAESTRPGFSPITVDEEIDRLKGIIEEISSSVSIPISIDTTKPEVAEFAISNGAGIINDVSGLSDEKMIDVVKNYNVPAVIMHVPCELKNVHDLNRKISSLNEIYSFFEKKILQLKNIGIEDNLILDPGIGFGKSIEENIEIIDNISYFNFGNPILVGASRKRIVKHLYPNVDEDEASALLAKKMVNAGANIVRTHNVKKTLELLQN